MSHDHIAVRLGPQWRAFAFGEYDDLMFLGTVQRGVAGIGALARTPEGGYVQVNGYVVEVLNTFRVKQALAGAHGTARQTPAPAPQPVVRVKKRRLPVRATVPANEQEGAGSPA
jgi:hypothetical protein